MLIRRAVASHAVRAHQDEAAHPVRLARPDRPLHARTVCLFERDALARELPQQAYVVNDGVAAFDCRVERPGIIEVALAQAASRRLPDLALAARTNEQGRPMPGFQQCVDEITANEAGSAYQSNFHDRSCNETVPRREALLRWPLRTVTKSWRAPRAAVRAHHRPARQTPYGIRAH